MRQIITAASARIRPAQRAVCRYDAVLTLSPGRHCEPEGHSGERECFGEPVAATRNERGSGGVGVSREKRAHSAHHRKPPPRRLMGAASLRLYGAAGEKIGRSKSANQAKCPCWHRSGHPHAEPMAGGRQGLAPAHAHALWRQSCDEEAAYEKHRWLIEVAMVAPACYADNISAS